MTAIAPLVLVGFMACGSKSQPAPASEPTKSTEPAKTPDPKAGEPTKTTEPAKTPDPAPADPTKAPEPAAAADAGAAPADPDAGAAADPMMDDDAMVGVNVPQADVSNAALFQLTATPGTIVKDPNPESPEGLITRALQAAMEPDEAKGWTMFEALLHDDQKYGQALEYRRQMNFPAMRRKVKLFLIEDPNKPIYQVDRTLVENPTTIRIFVHNKESMPTPCQLRLDDTGHWKIGICSL
ncbi:MAG: hypothetical protein U1F43_06095 [Myxococcota bacterium]